MNFRHLVTLVIGIGAASAPQSVFADVLSVPLVIDPGQINERTMETGAVKNIYFHADPYGLPLKYFQGRVQKENGVLIMRSSKSAIEAQVVLNPDTILPENLGKDLIYSIDDKLSVGGVQIKALAILPSNSTVPVLWCDGQAEGIPNTELARSFFLRMDETSFDFDADRFPKSKGSLNVFIYEHPSSVLDSDRLKPEYLKQKLHFSFNSFLDIEGQFATTIDYASEGTGPYRVELNRMNTVWSFVLYKDGDQFVGGARGQGMYCLGVGRR